MLQKALVSVLSTAFLLGCVSQQSEPTSAQVESAAQIVKSFTIEVSALADDFPELAGFSNQSPSAKVELEVRFANGLEQINEMRGVRSNDLEAHGIYMSFLVRPRSNPVWTDKGSIALNTIEMNLYSDFVLPEHSTPGLEEALAAIFERHHKMFMDLDKK